MTKFQDPSGLHQDLCKMLLLKELSNYLVALWLSASAEIQETSQSMDDAGRFILVFNPGYALISSRAGDYQLPMTPGPSFGNYKTHCFRIC